MQGFYTALCDHKSHFSVVVHVFLPCRWIWVQTYKFHGAVGVTELTVQSTEEMKELAVEI